MWSFAKGRPTPRRNSTRFFHTFSTASKESLASLHLSAWMQVSKVIVLEKHKTPYIGRLKPNATPDKLSAPYLVRPDETELPKEPGTWFYEFGYCAGSWSRFRREILVVLEKPCQLWLDHFWLVTSWSCDQMFPAELLPLYRTRGSAEDHMGKWVNTLRPRLSSAGRTKRTYGGKPMKKSICMREQGGVMVTSSRVR
jgi:hypothetical protein